MKSGISLSVLTLVSRVLGLIREMTKSTFLGTGPLADAFTVAFMIPNLLRRIFAENSMTVAFIPTFQTYLEEEKRNTPDAKAAMKEFLSATFTMLSFAVTGTVIIGILCSGLIVAVFFPKIGDFRNGAFDADYVSIPAAHLRGGILSGDIERRPQLLTDRDYADFV